MNVLNHYPRFANFLTNRMKTKGRYAKGFPLGAVVHFTAGRDGARNTILGGIKDGYAYWCIQRDGQLFAAHPVNEWGYHAGESRWKNLVGGVSDDLIGIEMNAAGKVTPLDNGKYQTWFKEILPASEVRYTPGKDNQNKGFYHVYTKAQEQALIETLLWLKSQAPHIFSFDLVLGHDEVSGPLGIGYWRKTDPGAALSMTMPEFRKLLKERWLVDPRNKEAHTLTPA
jgi:N-acetyl-anhydromuramyl-L-alanine amidase AmpD